MIDMDKLTALAATSIAKISKYTPAASKFRLGKFEKWSKGKKLKILLVGYNGARNTGADVRVAAMVKQFEKVLGKNVIEISILTQNIENFKIYFDPWIKFILINPVYFKDVFDACSSHHMAVLCEGSTLKSKFANALTLCFCEAAGIMKNQGKPCIAYGSEAGQMDPFVRDIASDLCGETYFIARTGPSLKIIHELGMSGHIGTDTAWTFPSGPKKWAEEKLRETGWDGKKPIIGAAVINPFWWPVKPSLTKLARSYILDSWDYHYRKWYFFSSSKERKKQMEKYLKSIAEVLDNFADRHGGHIVIIGMEALDLDACGRLQRLLKHPSEIFPSQHYNGYQLCSILRRLSLLVTSRYHARVISMAGGVPAVAVSMDERLENIFGEIGHGQDYYLEVDEDNLMEKLDRAVETLWENRSSASKDIIQKLPDYLEMLGEMGMFMYDYVKDKFPGSPLPPPPESWRDALGPIEPELEELISG